MTSVVPGDAFAVLIALIKAATVPTLALQVAGTAVPVGIGVGVLTMAGGAVGVGVTSRLVGLRNAATRAAESFNALVSFSVTVPSARPLNDRSGFEK